MEKNANKSVEEVKTSMESKMKEEVETLLGASLEEISGGVINEAIAEEEKSCSCGVAFAKA